jgi:hypothetical protein
MTGSLCYSGIHLEQLRKTAKVPGPLHVYPFNDKLKNVWSFTSDHSVCTFVTRAALASPLFDADVFLPLRSVALCTKGTKVGAFQATGELCAQ